MSLKDKAKEYLNSGLSVVFTKEDKRPALYSWRDLEHTALTPGEVDTLLNGGVIRLHIEREVIKEDGSKFIAKGIKQFTTPVGLAIIGGKVSGNLEVIDVDTKYDTTGGLWDEFRTLIEDNLPEIFNSFVIAQTVSGGYHIYYRCKEIKGNLKLAVKKNKEVLIETRGEGGYVIAPPTEKYKYIQGEPFKLPTITPEQREILFSIAKSFTEIEEEPVVYTPSANGHSSTGLTPWEDYDNRGDVVGLLEKHGWKVVSKSGERVHLLRPGDTKTKTSANFHTRLRKFFVWSSSTEFTPEKGYKPSKLFYILECNGDSSQGAKRLIEQGYGDKQSGGYRGPTQIKTELITVNSVNKVTRESSVISLPGESLKIENIQTAIGEEIVISSPGTEATNEVLKAIELIQERGIRTYIRQAGEPELREYQFQLNSILKKYSELQEGGGGALTQREIDGLLDEIVIVSKKIKNPLDKDQYKKEFTSQEFIKELGITEESFSITLDRLTTTQEKEDQEKEFKELLSEVTNLQEQGETAKALELLDKRSKQIKAITGAGLIPPPMSFTTLLEEIATTPPAFQTGYPSLDKFIGFTPGAISLIAGRPSHGKTTLMFNLLLEMSSLYRNQGYKFKYFHYEEPNRNIGIKILNRLTATDLSSFYGGVKMVKRTNYEFIKAYITAGRTDIPQLEEGKRLLKELLDSQTIQLIETRPTVENLSKLMAHYCKEQKIGGVFIDYIQRMTTEKKTEGIRVETNTISKTLLDIAVSNNIPLIVGAQLNRESVKTGTKKPTLEGLKESGNLEEDANTVLSVYNESREREENAEGESYDGLKEVELEIKALKNREGEVNKKAKLTFDKWTGVIKDQDTIAKNMF